MPPCPYPTHTTLPPAFTVITTESIMTQSLCSLILFISVISRRPRFPDHPLTLRVLSSSFRETDCLCNHLSLLPNTLRYFHYILLCSVSSTVTYVPPTSCAESRDTPETPISIWHSQVIAICLPYQLGLKMRWWISCSSFTDLSLTLYPYFLLPLLVEVIYHSLGTLP